ncbi:MAG TPA: haloacid dehalogenase [Chloroflexota bacterium]|nr:haloacid dehalogenase [Chloroflexota bacterium]
MLDGIERQVLDCTAELQTKNDARDRALVDSRDVVRQAARAIRALHRGEWAEAEDIVSRGREIVRSTRSHLENFPDVYWAGYVQDAQKEFAEASLLTAMIAGSPIPTRVDLGVEVAPYLNGLAEAASELRRYILDIVRHGGLDRLREAERALKVMDDVYSNLITVDYPDAITGGLRRTTDALRAVLERTRGDLTITSRQAELEQALRGHPVT